MSSRSGDNNNAGKPQSQAQPQPSHRPSPARPEGPAAATLRDRFTSALSVVDRRTTSPGGAVPDKPDAKRFDLGSPVSPLRAPPSSTTTTTGLTITSSSSSSSGSVTARAPSQQRAAAANARREALVGKSHSGELSGGSSGAGSPTAVDSPGSTAARVGGRVGRGRPGHRRTGSGAFIFAGGSGSGSGSGSGGKAAAAAGGSGSGSGSGSGGKAAAAVGGSGGGGCAVSSVSSPPINVLPAGNICPSGKIGKIGMMPRTSPRSDVLGSGTGNYGHGSIMRGGVSSGTSPRHSGRSDALAAGSSAHTSPASRQAMYSSDPEELKRIGNEQYSRGRYAEAIQMYDRALALRPDNAPCRSNRAAALIAMGRLAEAVRECEEAIRLDPAYGRAHQRLASVHIRLAQIEQAQKHLNLTGELPDPVELRKLRAIENHLMGCADMRKNGDWKGLLRESESAIAAGADSSVLFIASKAEALLHLRRIKEAESALSNTVRLELLAPSSSQMKLFDMPSSSYLGIVKAQVEMALGRFENAESNAEKARALDPQNKEVSSVLMKVKSVARAWARGKELFESGRFSEACLAYGDGLKSDPFNSILYCNRAVCHSKLEQWQKSVDDCNEALKLQPDYTKALSRRAACYAKLEKWVEAVQDYEALRKVLPQDKEVAEALFHAQIALKTSRGEEVSNMSFGGEVEVIKGVEQFGAAISMPGVSVIYFMKAQNIQCNQISPFVDTLCGKYPTVNFHKVKVEENQELSNMENVRIVPTFKFYKNGVKLKEIICPNQQVLEYSVRHYSL